MQINPTLIDKNQVTQEIYTIDTEDGTYSYVEYISPDNYVVDFVLRHPLGFDITTNEEYAKLLEAIQQSLPEH